MGSPAVREDLGDFREAACFPAVQVALEDPADSRAGLVDPADLGDSPEDPEVRAGGQAAREVRPACRKRRRPVLRRRSL